MYGGSSHPSNGTAAPAYTPYEDQGYSTGQIHAMLVNPYETEHTDLRRQQSIGAQSLAPSDSASHMGMEDSAGHYQQEAAQGPGLSMIDEERESSGDLGQRGAAYPMEPLRRAMEPINHHMDPHGYQRDGALRSGRSTGGFAYTGEQGNHLRTDRSRPHSAAYPDEREYDNEDDRGLIPGAAKMGSYDHSGRYPEDGGKNGSYPPSTASQEQSAPLQENPWYLQIFGVGHGKYPIEQQIENKRRGIGIQRWPYVCYILTIAMTSVMIWELFTNYAAQGTPISTKPNFNYMIGPSAEVLISDGARFVPCMKYVEALPPSYELACLSDTANPPTTSCTLGTICGFGGVADSEIPNQWWRFILPIFLHVGIIHLVLNMAAQIIAGGQVEREMGSVRFAITYFAGGIYGFALGGNFSRTGIPSAGASGALFATNACIVVDLGLHWAYEERPYLKAGFLLVEFLIGVAIGYIPYAVDGMAHLGGFAMGLLCGMILYPAISETRRHKIVVWTLRAVALPMIIVAFVLTFKNFYTDDPNAACEWCRYLSCFPTSSNNRCTGTGLTTTTTTTTTNSTRRSWELL